MRRAFIGLIALTILSFVSLIAAGAVSAHGEKVLVCKYVGTPDVDERLQTGNNPIVVSVNALEDGFTGVFPFEFSDQHGRSVAIRYLAEGENSGDTFSITECGGEGPVVTPTPMPSVTPAPTPSESPSDAPSDAPSAQPTPSDVPNTAMAGPDEPTLAEILVAIGLLALLGAILLSIVLFELYRDATRGR